MIRTKITRTMATSEIKGYRVKVEKGVPSAETLDPIVMGGKVKEKDALKALEKQYGKGVIVGDIVVSEDVYEISVEDFLKYATKVGSEVVTEGSENTEENSEGSEKVSKGSEKVATK
jgi:hypothetical protein